MYNNCHFDINIAFDRVNHYDNLALWLIKRNFIIEKQLLRNYELKTANVFHTPHPFNAYQIISPFLKSRVRANHDKVERLSVNGEILIKGIVILL